MEKENTKNTTAQEESSEKGAGMEWCRDCCEGMPISEGMKKKMMGMCKDMPEPAGMSALFKGCCASRKSDKA